MKWNVDISPFWMRILVYVALAVAAFILFRVWISSRDDARANVANVEQGQRTAQATSGITQDAQSAQESTHTVEVVVSDGRAQYQRGYEDAKRKDPSVAEWVAQPVPQRLRDLARERRVQRERLGRDGDGSEVDPSPPRTGR